MEAGKRKKNIQVAIPVIWEASGIEPDAGVEPMGWMLELTHFRIELDSQLTRNLEIKSLTLYRLS